METQLKLIPASEHPTALESQWLNAISPADFINNNKINTYFPRNYYV